MCQGSVLKYLEDNGPATARDMATHLGVSIKAVNVSIVRLMMSNDVTVIGYDNSNGGSMRVVSAVR